MFKTIFIGSSTEGSNQAESILSLLSRINEVKPLYWKDVFTPSELTLSAIENTFNKVSGALLLATPDDPSVIREKPCKVPRSNVIFELGLFSARLGRSNVALCKYDGVTLPTDLESFTYIAMGEFNPDSAEITEGAKEKISRWVNGLWPLPSNIPRTRLFSGFTDRWRIIVTYSKWRGNNISLPSSVMADGYIDFFHPEDRQTGNGVICGELEINLHDQNSKQVYYSKINVCDKVSDLKYEHNTIKFKSETFSRQIVSENGDSSYIPGTAQIIPGVKHYEWILTPNPNDHLSWTGSYGTVQSGFSAATVRAWKV
jgi:hypothetical protein